MIHVTEDGKEFWVTLERPSVYLDHKALRDLSSKSELRTRFLAAMHRRGTLLFSIINLLECAGNSGPSAEALASFLDEVGPRWALIDLNWRKVIEREGVWDSVGDHPARDLFLLKHYLRQWRDVRPEELSAPSLKLMMELSQDPEVRPTLQRELRDCKAELLPLLQEDSEACKRRTLRQPGYDPGNRTKYVYRSLLRQFLRRNKKPVENDVADVLHAVVPLACADFVVLDRAWTGFARQARLPTGADEYAQVFNFGEIEVSFRQACRAPPASTGGQLAGPERRWPTAPQAPSCDT